MRSSFGMGGIDHNGAHFTANTFDTGGKGREGEGEEAEGRGEGAALHNSSAPYGKGTSLGTSDCEGGSRGRKAVVGGKGGARGHHSGRSSCARVAALCI